MDFPCSSDGKESASNARDPGLIPGSKDPGEGNDKSTPVFSPGESHGQRSPAGHVHGVSKESDTTKQLTPLHYY